MQRLPLMKKALLNCLRFLSLCAFALVLALILWELVVYIAMSHVAPMSLMRAYF